MRLDTACTTTLAHLNDRVENGNYTIDEERVRLTIDQVEAFLNQLLSQLSSL